MVKPLDQGSPNRGSHPCGVATAHIFVLKDYISVHDIILLYGTVLYVLYYNELVYNELHYVLLC